MKYFKSYSSLLEDTQLNKEIRKEKSTRNKNTKKFLTDYKKILKVIKNAQNKKVFDNSIKEKIEKQLKSLIDSNKNNIMKSGNILNLDEFDDELRKDLHDSHSVAKFLIEKEPENKETVTSNDVEGKQKGEKILSDAIKKSESTKKDQSKSEEKIIGLDGEYKSLYDSIKSNGEAPLVKTGQRNNYVKLLQKICNNMIGSSIKIDGIFGNNTLKSIKSLQNKLKVKSDGIFGSNSWTSLMGKDIKVKKSVPKQTTTKEIDSKQVNTKKTSYVNNSKNIINNITTNGKAEINKEDLLSMLKESASLQSKDYKYILTSDNKLDIYDDNNKIKTIDYTISNNKIKFTDEDKEKLKSLISISSDEPTKDKEESTKSTFDTKNNKLSIDSGSLKSILDDKDYNKQKQSILYFTDSDEILNISPNRLFLDKGENVYVDIIKKSHVNKIYDGLYSSLVGDVTETDAAEVYSALRFIWNKFCLVSGDTEDDINIKYVLDEIMDTYENLPNHLQEYIGSDTKDYAKSKTYNKEYEGGEFMKFSKSYFKKFKDLKNISTDSIMAISKNDTDIKDPSSYIEIKIN